MVATKSQDKKFNTFLQQLQSDYPYINFEISEYTRWQPETNTVFYEPDSPTVIWSLLHETGHIISGHKSYKLDVQLVMMEAEAWKVAENISKKYGMKIDPDHIQDCLDSYRDWLHGRSLCPNCEVTCVQAEAKNYFCGNCNQSWKVSSSRFCRTYRQKQKRSS